MTFPDLESRRSALLGGLALVGALAQFLLCHLIVEAVWSPPYSWADNNISDLGNVRCGPWGDDGRYVCSPRHLLMNTSFVLTGVLLLTGLVLTSRVWRSGRLGHRLLAAGAGGWVLAGLAPADMRLSLHLLGAVAIFGLGNAGLVATGLARGPARPPLPIGALACGLAGLAGTVLFFAGSFLGLGMGGMERVAALPILVWPAVAGIVFVSRLRRRRRHEPPVRGPRVVAMAGRSASRVTVTGVRAAGYLLLRVPLALTAGLALLALAGSRGRPGVLVSGAVLLLLASALDVVTAGLQRQAVAVLGHPPVPAPARRGRRPTRRELTHALVTVVLAPVDLAVLTVWPLVSLILVAAPLFAAGGPITLGPVTVEGGLDAWVACAVGLSSAGGWLGGCVALARTHAAAATTLLGPGPAGLRDQVTDLARSRQRLVDSFDGERRRIERDLHDGVQQHLVALGMTLDLARLELRDGPGGPVAELVDRAHTQATATLRDLRDLVRGIHPPVLTELGLPAAVRELADRCGLPVTVQAELPGRVPAPVETAAYFVVAEALTNAVRHSGAEAAVVRLAADDRQLVVEVRDDGAGGAAARPGSGLAGLADRVAAVGGSLTVSSPIGGPTVLLARLPTREGAP